MKFPLPPFLPELRLAKYDKLPHLFYASSAEPFPLRELESLQDEEVTEQLNRLGLGYAPTGGHPMLLAEIADHYGAPITAVDVLTFPGAQTGIFSTLTSLLDEGDHAVVVSPCYPSLENIPAAICETTQVRLRFDRKWEVDLDEIRDALRPNTKVIILNSPNAPTGSLISAQTQAQLVELARARGVWIFSDEVYRLLELDSADCLAPIATIYEKGISLGVMSKPFGLGGLQIGWVACQDPEILAATAELKNYMAVCNSAVSEFHAVTAFRNKAAIISSRRQICISNMVLLDDFFEEYADLFEWVRPRSGSVGFPKLKSKLSVEEFAQQLADGPGVLVMPASVFGFAGNFFRIGFSRHTMPRSLEKFTEWVDTHRNSL
jgi:aspartate/methionine/tyrosine aminotransferase